jgi:Tfp pilus assembly protein PilN
MRAVNLIPSEHRGGLAGADRSGGGAYAVLVLLAGLAIFALLYGMAHHQVSSREAQVTSLTARAQKAEAASAQLTPYSSFVAMREQRMQAVAQLVDSRFDWAHAFHELGRVLPYDASISSLEGTIGSSTPSASSAPSSSSASTAATSTAVSSATPPGSVPTFTLNGCATSQAEVALTLERLRLIDGVSEVTLQSSTRSATQGGSGGAGGGCRGGAPAFTVQVSFDPLPAVPATSASGTKLTTLTGAEK